MDEGVRWVEKPPLGDSHRLTMDMIKMQRAVADMNARLIKLEHERKYRALVNKRYE